MFSVRALASIADRSSISRGRGAGRAVRKTIRNQIRHRNRNPFALGEPFIDGRGPFRGGGERAQASDDLSERPQE
jgi:hypothetical protein